MKNTMTVVAYDFYADEFTIVLKNENEKVVVPAADFALRYQESRSAENSLKAFDKALAEIFELHFDDDPAYLVDKSVEF